MGGLHEQCDALEARISKLESARGGDLRAVLAQEKQEAETLRAAIGEKEQTIAMKQQLNEEKKKAAELKKKIAAADKPAKQPKQAKQAKQAKQSGGAAADKLPPVRPLPLASESRLSIGQENGFGCAGWGVQGRLYVRECGPAGGERRVGAGCGRGVDSAAGLQVRAHTLAACC